MNTYYDIKIEGGGTREEIAEGLRLIASALDGKGGHPEQHTDDIDGAEWNDCRLRTEIKDPSIYSKAQPK